MPPRVYRRDELPIAGLKILRTDELSPAKDVVGGFMDVEAYATRTGVFEYTLEDGSVRRELRHPDDVFEQESMDSLRRVPVTHTHPKEDVTADNCRELACGWVGDTVEVVEDRFLKVSQRLFDKDLIADVLAGKVEVSCGYWCELIEESGEFEGEAYDFRQTKIRYNHEAAGIDAGRAGPNVKIRTDSAQGSERGEDAMHVKRTDSGDAPKRTYRLRLDHAQFKKHGIVVPRNDMELPEESGQMIEGALAAALDALTAAQAEIDKLKGEAGEAADAMAEVEKERDEEKARADEAEARVKKIDSTVEAKAEQRQHVVLAASQVLEKRADAFKGKTLDQIRTEVLTYVHQDEAETIKAESEEYRRARFDSVIKSLDSNPLPPSGGDGGAFGGSFHTDEADDFDELAAPYLEEVGARPTPRIDSRTAQDIAHVRNQQRGTRPLALSKRS